MKQKEWCVRRVERFIIKLFVHNVIQLYQLKLKTKTMENVIEVGIYYYVDENGTKVYDTEEMTREFEQKLSELDESFM